MRKSYIAISDDKKGSFRGEIDFSEVKFMDLINFSNRRFHDKTNFSNCLFEKAPEFHNCKLHQNTIFPEYHNFKDTKIADASRAYRTLALAMAHFKARREEAMFYALEQKSLRKSLDLSDRIFSYLYDLTSNYGQSLRNIFVSILTVFIIFWFIYGFWFSPAISIHSHIDCKIVADSFEYTIQQIVKPFSVWAAWAPDNSLSYFSNIHQILLFKITATFQSLIFLILITLLIFTIRWKFKRE